MSETPAAKPAAKPKPPKPEDKPGYDKSKDAGAKAPKGADILFDGTQKSIDSNWEMWPKSDMKITWSLVKSPTDDTKVLMTNGGKSWGTHDLVTKKKYKDFEGHVDFVLCGQLFHVFLKFLLLELFNPLFTDLSNFCTHFLIIGFLLF